MQECEFVRNTRKDLERLKLYSPAWWRLSSSIDDHKAGCKDCER
jgi:hypothetical protein